MSNASPALVRLTHRQLAHLAAEEPGVRWPRALRALLPGERDARSGDPLPEQFGDPQSAPPLRRGLRAFGRPRLRVRVVLRQGRLLTLTEVAADAGGSAGSLSTLLLDGDPAVTPRQVRAVGRVELAGTEAAALPGLSLRHVPASHAGSERPTTARAGPPEHPARTLVLRGWGRALARPFVDVWAQDEHGWVRPDCHSAPGSDTESGWLPVDAGRFAADLAGVLTEPWPGQLDQRWDHDE